LLLYNDIMNTLPPRPKKPQLIPLPLIFVVVFIISIIIWGQFISVSGKTLTILHTNDLQGEILPFHEEVDGKKVEIGGIARIATVVKDIKNKTKRVLLVDTGDTIQGTLYTRIPGAITDIGELMSEIGYNAVTIGEHDFDKGPEGLREYILSSTFPFLAANLDVTKSQVLKNENNNSMLAPYVIVDMSQGDEETLKVGIIGVTTEEANIFAKTGSDVFVTDPVDAVRRVIDGIKEKADIVIVLSHLGLNEDRQLASRVNGIDIIIGGHSKTKLTVPVLINNPDGRKTIIVQAKNQGRYIGKLDVAINNRATKLVDYKLLPLDETVVPDNTYATKITSLQDRLEKEAKKPIGETKVPLNVVKSHIRTGETNLGSLVAEAIREEFPEVDVVLQNSGGIRGDTIIPPGKLTMKEVYEWHPFENKIVLVTITGKQLKDVLERGVSNLPISKGTFLQVAGLSYTVDLTGEPQQLSEDNQRIKIKGDRIIDIKVNNKPIDYNKDYRVAINDFIYYGGDGFVTFKDSRKVVFTNVSLTKIIMDYIQKHSPISIQTDGRIQVKGGLLR
jgi:5'-nucleotidase / UDP-sugar diphosphatase